jgi:hypothetical protein
MTPSHFSAKDASSTRPANPSVRPSSLGQQLGGQSTRKYRKRHNKQSKRKDEGERARQREDKQILQSCRHLLLCLCAALLCTPHHKFHHTRRWSQRSLDKLYEIAARHKSRPVSSARVLRDFSFNHVRVVVKVTVGDAPKPAPGPPKTERGQMTSTILQQQESNDKHHEQEKNKHVFCMPTTFSADNTNDDGKKQGKKRTNNQY